ncbi:MAG: sugar phosphate isomerase/epimerase [Clostridia bacterium]|nr:sugar phosphate isomerase/epimerase [Clostridia bacterium]
MEIGIHTENFHDGQASFEQRQAMRQEGYTRMRQAGFTCADLSVICNTKGIYYTADLETAKEMARAECAAAAAAGIRIHQVHGPWPTDDTTAENRKEKIGFMERAIRLTPAFGARYLVIHSDMPLGWWKEDEALAWQTNTALLRAILPIAEEEGVTICIENMPMTALAISRTKRMYEFVQEINHPNLGMCLDTGHANVFGDDCGDMVRLIAPVLKVLHVHDNLGDKDAHLPPYQGTINWESFTAALRETGFNGVLSIEASLDVRNMQEDGHAEAARRMAEIARKLADAAS